MIAPSVTRLSGAANEELQEVSKMVAGHLEVKNGKYFVMISYLDEYGKRHRKQFPTGLPEKGNRRNAEAELARIRKEFKPPATVIAGDWSPDMLSQIICSNGWRSLKCA